MGVAKFLKVETSDIGLDRLLLEMVVDDEEVIESKQDNIEFDATSYSNTSSIRIDTEIRSLFSTLPV